MLSRTRVESTDVPEACSLFPYHNSDEKVERGEKGDNTAFVTRCTLLLSVEITYLKLGKSKGLFLLNLYPNLIISVLPGVKY